MPPSPASTALDLAARAHHVVTTSELLGEGLTADQVGHLVRLGILDRVARGVFRVAASRETWEQRLRVAVLVGGAAAVVSHRAAARLHAIEGFDRAPLEVTVPRGRRGRARRSIVHQSSDLERRDTTRRAGLPVTNPARTLVDLGQVVDVGLVEVAVDDALRRGLTTLDHIADVHERVGRRGRAGTAPITTLLDERGELLGTTDSILETRLLRVLLDAGLPHPVPQFEVVAADGERIGRFDFAYPDPMVLIEVDSERWHTGRRRFVHDRTRRDRAEAMGWRVLAFTHHHISQEQGFVASVVSSTLSHAA